MMNKMNRLKKYTKVATLSLVLAFAMVSCDSYLETDEDNRLILDEIIEDPSLAEGLLLNAYNNLPTNYNFNIDVASDDAQSNNPNLNINIMNDGGWNADFNPISEWASSYESLLYLNSMLEVADEVIWFPSSVERDTTFRTRIKAEARGLRAWYNFKLLQAHAGRGSNGQLLGFPIVDEVLSVDDDIQLPRNSFAECVDFIIQDCDSAIAGLPARFAGDDPILGERNLNRISGLAAALFKSRVALYAASPSYAQSGAGSWQEAAEFAADVIDLNGGVTPTSDDVTFYLAQNTAGQPGDILWSSTILPNTNGGEQSNLPPSQFGNGNTNPTQNFVDAFGMADGTPILESADYDPNDPYTGRDPRLEAYVITHNSSFSGNLIKTSANSGLDALNATTISTVSGYYIRKFMNPDVSLDPSGNVTGAPHYYTYARMIEAYLNFAEAANEAVGPDGSVGGYSVKEVLNAIRTRAGITSTAYVDGISDQAAMRELIRNERRIELAFEGHRFWDLRRWGLTDVIRESVQGIEISEDESTYSIFTVDTRNYAPFQLYGPIPLNETLKYDLIQNAGY